MKEAKDGKQEVKGGKGREEEGRAKYINSEYKKTWCRLSWSDELMNLRWLR